MITTFLWCAIAASSLPLDRIALPDGFIIAEYVSGIPDARSMAIGPKGTLIVGTRNDGRLWAVLDTNGDFRVDRKVAIASGLTNPNGVAFNGADLYVAERSRILKYPNIEERIDRVPQPQIIKADFPSQQHHGWKYIAFGPDGYLYVPVGAPCNICLEKDPRFASITRMKPDGSDFSIFAKGIRTPLVLIGIQRQKNYGLPRIEPMGWGIRFLQMSSTGHRLLDCILVSRTVMREIFLILSMVTCAPAISLSNLL
jgi:glucose/arabinose dehydrogenase